MSTCEVPNCTNPQHQEGTPGGDWYKIIKNQPSKQVELARVIKKFQLRKTATDYSQWLELVETATHFLSETDGNATEFLGELVADV